MFKKALSAVVTLAFLLVGLTAVTPALAWQDTNSETGTRVSADSLSSYVPVGKTIAGEMVFAYSVHPEGQDGSSYLRTYTVSQTGVISEPITIDTSSTQNFYIHADMIWVDPAGTLHVAYKSMSANSSKISYVTSKDGRSWSAPTVLVDYNWNVCSVEGQCGIREVVLVPGGAGNLALMYAFTTPAGMGEIHTTTKAPGKRWLTPSKIFSSANVLYALNVVSTGKGLLATWYEYSTVPRLVSSFSTSLSSKSWTAPQQRAQSSDLVIWELMQIGTTKFALVYSQSNEDKLKMQVFDAATRRFGVVQEITTVDDMAFAVERFYTKYVAGQSALVFVESPALAQTRTTAAKYVLFRNGVASTHYLNPELEVIPGSMQSPQGATMDKSGHLTITWIRMTEDFVSRMFVSQIYRGNRSDAEVTMEDQTAGTYEVGYSQDGDLYMSNFLDSTISAKVRIRSDAPSLDSNVGISGSPKVSKSVKVKQPKITASVSGQKWLKTYQWYSCQLRVTEAATIPTDNCTALAGATSSSYKAKKTDKGKFLQVRLSVRSDNATQVQYSASTSVVK